MAVRKKPKPLLFVLIALVVVVIATLGTISYLKSPVDSKDDNIIQVEIPANSGISTIAKILKNRNLIKSETYFKVYVKIHTILKILKLVHMI